MKTQRFGVEIEMTGISRSAAAGVIAKHFHTTKEHRPEMGYDTRRVKDPQGRWWKVVSDVSITPQKGGTTLNTGNNRNIYQVEVVTPILTWGDIETLQQVVRALRKAGAKVNGSCGIHIHVDAAPHTPTSLRNLINIFASREDMIYKALDVKNSRLKHCKKLRTKLVDDVNGKKTVTLDDLAAFWYDGSNPANARYQHYHDTRYCGLNLHAVWYKGTVEFRAFNSTLHAGEVKAYIHLALGMSHQALKQRAAKPAKPDTDNEKYTFRCWLLRLGFIGPEFESTREHLTKNLSGNGAWRHGRPA